MRQQPRTHRPTRTFYLLNRVNAAVNLQLEKLLRPLDITVAQYTSMSRIRGHEVMSSAKLARAHRVSPQTMYEMIVNLEKRGFLKRQKSPDNRKQLLVSLTHEGRQILDLCDRRVDEIEPLTFAGINTASHALLRELLQIVIRNATGTEPGEAANDEGPLALPRGERAQGSARTLARIGARRR